MADGVPDCGHCGQIQGKVNETCKKNNWQVNHLVLIFDAAHPDGCNCTCSCLAFGTPVQAGDGQYRAIEKYKVGDSVLASGLTSGAKLNWKPLNVEFSNGTPGTSLQRHTILVLYKDTAMAVTSDHLFLMADRKLKRADRLAPGDQLVDPAGNAVPIASVHIGNMFAGFHHIATRKEEPKPDLDGHLLNTNGIVSADYAVQLFYRNADNRVKNPGRYLEDHHDNLPIVGSEEYVAKHGADSLSAPKANVQNFAGTGGVLKAAAGEPFLRVTMINNRDQLSGSFVPAEATRTQVPPNAHPFISKADAKARAAAPKRPFNDPQSRGWAEWLLEYFGYFYPAINYTLDWQSNEVNAHAWVDPGGQRRVDIKGGIVRDAAVLLEGLALVIAHETGHHYGGPPTFPDGLSCEGQADYEGVASILRKVWYGTDFITKTKLAIAQMANFFGVPNTPTAPSGSAGCDHPPGACRIATYYAAAALQDKPACAS